MFFTDWRQLPASTDYLQPGGWVWRGIVPWCKPGARPQFGRFTAQREYVIWGTAGAVSADDSAGRIPGFYECSAPRNRVHVTQKPVEQLRIVPLGGCVLDSFMGSGSCGVAALQTGRRFVGISWTRRISITPVSESMMCTGNACNSITPAKREQVRMNFQGRDIFGMRTTPLLDDLTARLRRSGSLVRNRTVRPCSSVIPCAVMPDGNVTR
nr:DNA methyltransferase [Paraburkholderia sp. J76]